jgi:hypothetical protein
MLTRRGAASVVVGGLLTAGCAIHPVPENMTGVSTYEIVRHIRCETRKAAIESILDYLTDERNLNSDKKLGVDAHSHQVGLDYQKRVDETPSSIATFKPDLLTGQAKSVVDVVWDTGIAAYYDLTMTETNNIDPTLDLVRSLTKNTLKLGLTGNYDRMRKNERSFTTTDNFGDLIAKVPSDYCNGQIVQANMNYPVAGEIGMKRSSRISCVWLCLPSSAPGRPTRPPRKPAQRRRWSRRWTLRPRLAPRRRQSSRLEPARYRTPPST